MKHQSEAAKRVGVRVHAGAYLVTMILLVAINIMTGPPYWVAWVLPGWTVGLFCHWYFVLGRGVRSSHARVAHGERRLGD